MTIVIRPLECDPLPGSFEVRITVRGSDTNGVLASLEQVLVPKAFIPPHTHSNDVWVYVLEGEVGVLVDDEIAHARVGHWALKPRDIPHAMWNATDRPARIIEVLTPAGSEVWFEEIARLDPTDSEAFDKACRRHGISFDRESPWIPRLKQQYGL